MNKNDWIFLIIVVVVLSLLVYLISTLVTAAAEIVSALIGLAGVILAAVLKYSMEVEKSRLQSLRIEKQRNYQKLLERVGEYASDPSGARYPLCTVHIESWVFGDTKVVLATNKFMKERSRDALKGLLLSMRESVELPSLDLQDYDPELLFPTTTRVTNEGLR